MILRANLAIRDKYVYWFLVSALSVSIALQMFAFPWQMDEFIMFHTLACTQSSQQLNIYREACLAYPISLGSLEYQRSYQYVGAISSILYAPFHWVLPYEWTNYFVGMIYLFGVVTGISKSFRLSRITTLIITLAFPLSYGLIHDGGPVRLTALVIAWTPFICNKAILSNKNLQVLTVFLSGIWVLATEDKPFFLFLIPGVWILTWASIMRNQNVTFLKAVKSTKVSLLFATISSVTILLVLRVNSASYLSSLSGSASLWSNLKPDMRSLLLLFSWPQAAHRTSSPIPVTTSPDTMPIEIQLRALIQQNPSLWLGYLFATLLTLILFVSLMLLWRRCSNDQQKILMIIFFATSAFFIGATVSGGWAIHHFLFVHLAFAIFTGLVIEYLKSTRSLILGAIALSTAISLVFVLAAPAVYASGKDIDKALEFAYAHADPRDIINCKDWGCYYKYSLLNRKNIPVVFGREESHMSNLSILVVEGKVRNIYHVCHFCSVLDAQYAYPGLTIQDKSFTSGDWKTFVFSAPIR